MKIQDVIQYLETLAPLDYAESFDNVGLLVGNAQEPFRGGSYHLGHFGRSG